MGVFGDGYDVASDVVLILSLTMLLATACGPVDSVLLMAGHSWLSLVNSTVTLAVNVGLNLVLIPLYGIRGAAIAWSVAIVVRNLLPLVQVRRHLSMWPLTRSAGLVGVGAAVVLRRPGSPRCPVRAAPRTGSSPACRRDWWSTQPASGTGGASSGWGCSTRRSGAVHPDAPGERRPGPDPFDVLLPHFEDEEASCAS